MLELSRHFREDWERWIGEPVPTSEEIEWMLKQPETGWLQRFRNLYTSRGIPFRVLAQHWVKENLIIRIDEKKRVVVGLMTWEKAGKKDNLTQSTQRH